MKGLYVIRPPRKMPNTAWTFAAFLKDQSGL